MKPIILWTLILAACAAAAQARATKVQKEAVKQALDLYTSPFNVPFQVTELAWDRASEWISVVPDRRIEVDTKNAIETYRSHDSSSMDLTCSVKRRKVAEGVSVTANCNIRNMFAAGEARRGSAMLRRYVMTGDERCLLAGDRWADAAGCLLECSTDGNACEPRPAELVFPEVVSEEPMLVGGCTLDQITSMAATGLSKDQIKAACGEG